MSEDDASISPLSILLDAKDHPSLAFLKGPHAPRIREGKLTILAGIASGMKGGKAAVELYGKLRDGSYVYLLTSYRLFHQAATALQARYGTEGDGTGTPLNLATQSRLHAALLLLSIKEREGRELTVHVDELNALMQDPTQDIEVAYSEDGKSITIRTQRSE